MKRISLFALLTLSLIAISGCNTLQGAGQDIENAGEELEDATEG